MSLMGSENILPRMHANTFEGHWKIVQIDAKTEKQWTWVDELCWTALQAKNRQRQLKPADQGASWESRNLAEFYVVKPFSPNRCKNTYDKVQQEYISSKEKYTEYTAQINWQADQTMDAQMHTTKFHRNMYILSKGKYAEYTDQTNWRADQLAIT